tara:strand:+ start:1236 stop:1409 length:174 start_codon:yes stop_codon:yes gene_type:complete
MIYLKNFARQVREYKDTDTKKVDELLASGRWTRVQGKKDLTPYVKPKANKKPSNKKK